MDNSGSKNSSGFNNAPLPKNGFTGIFDVLDLSSPLQPVYQAVLRVGDASLLEIRATLTEVPEEELKIYLNILARFDYLEKYPGPDGVRYKVRGRMRDKSSLPDSIWDKLK